MGHPIVNYGMSRPVIKNVLFDLDGTLTDPVEGITRCIQHALAKLAAPCPDETALRTYIGPPLRGTFAALLDSADRVLIERAMKFYRARFAETGLFENEVYEGVPGLLEALRASARKLYVATSKPKVYAERILKHFRLDDYFDGVYGSELDGRLDDKAELIGHLLQAERLAPAATLMVGDRRHDIDGAKRNLCAAMGVTYGYGTEAELRQAGADFICRSPQHIADLLRR